MKAFAQLFARLDQTTKTSEKTAGLAEYFQTAPDADRVWTIALLTGRRPKRMANSTELRQWAAEAAGIPDWLFEECYGVAGDLAETIARLLPDGTDDRDQSLATTVAELMALTGRSVEERRAFVLDRWHRQSANERFLFNKLLTGGFRVGVSQGLLVRALAQFTGQDEAALAHHLMGDWAPATTRFQDLLAAPSDLGARPYPFALASPFDEAGEELGQMSDWLVEWKWDGIRGQIIHRPGTFALWSRGEELITDRFPEFAPLTDFLPAGTVLDGEILAWRDGMPLPFADLQKRIGRKSVPKKLLAEAPAHFVAYDLLELGGTDLRAQPLATRRALLVDLLSKLSPSLPITISTQLSLQDWPDLAQSRARAPEHRAEGVMIKRLSSPYHTGRKRGDWWKYKVDPMTVDAVMIYAQAGHGRRANLFTDFTFAVKDGNDLVPFAKAYSGLTDAEFQRITAWVQKNTLERFGPVRRVRPELVFELAFEGIQHSPRHKSGIALRFPRMLRWRQDKTADQIDSLDDLRRFLPPGA